MGAIETLLFITIILSTPSSTLPTNTSTFQKPIVIDLIHIHSAKSPFFNPNATIEDLATYDLQRSMYRLNSLNAELYPNSTNFTVEESGRDYKAETFMIQLEVGTPAQNLVVGIDTGSYFPWVFCQRKDCPPSYKLSDTAVVVHCQNPVCKGERKAYCLPPNSKCFYKVRYADNTSCTGLVVKDVFAFPGDGTRRMTVFGYGLSTERRNLYDGVLGLGREGISVLQQYDMPVFSYCFNRLRYYDNGEFVGVLIFGYFDIIRGYPSTQLLIEDHYYVRITNIKVGRYYNIPLYNDPLKVAIDSGATLSFLPLPTVVLIENQVKAMMAAHHFQMVKVVPSYRLFCYAAILGAINYWMDYPLVTLKFGLGLPGEEFQIRASGVFDQVTYGIVCLAILPCHIDGVTGIIGALAQQHHIMSFDLEKEVLYYEEEFDCQKLPTILA